MKTPGIGRFTKIIILLAIFSWSCHKIKQTESLYLSRIHNRNTTKKKFAENQMESSILYRNVGGRQICPLPASFLNVSLSSAIFCGIFPTVNFCYFTLFLKFCRVCLFCFLAFLSSCRGRNLRGPYML